MDENDVYFDKVAASAILEQIKNKQGKINTEIIDNTTAILAKTIGDYNKALAEAHVEKPLRRALVLDLQRHLFGK